MDGPPDSNSDPGPEGMTADFEHTKNVGALMVFVVPVVAGALLVLVHWSALFGSRRE